MFSMLFEFFCLPKILRCGSKSKKSYPKIHVTARAVAPGGGRKYHLDENCDTVKGRSQAHMDVCLDCARKGQLSCRNACVALVRRASPVPSVLR